ncbi:MAG: HDOD domain-containing protein [Desulfuromonadaceae bacterium]
MSEDIYKIVDEMFNLPPMPSVAEKVLEMLRSPDYSAKSLADLIACDPVLAGRLLGMANSAFYGVRREVKTLPRAVVILGENALKSMVMTASLKSLNMVPGPLQRRLWEDSIGCALGAQMVARIYHSCLPEEAFLGGLFRHIGKMVMYRYNPARYEELVAAVDAGGVSQDYLEKEKFNFPHALIGAAVLTKWNFNRVMIQANLHHDRLDLSSEIYPAAYRLGATINLASNLCRFLGIGCAVPRTNLDLSKVPGALALEVSEFQMAALLQELQETFAENSGHFN